MNQCRFHHLPNKGSFTISNKYQWTYLIDAINVTDDNNKIVSFNVICFYDTPQNYKN